MHSLGSPSQTRPAAPRACPAMFHPYSNLRVTLRDPWTLVASPTAGADPGQGASTAPRRRHRCRPPRPTWRRRQRRRPSCSPARARSGHVLPSAGTALGFREPPPPPGAPSGVWPSIGVGLVRTAGVGWRGLAPSSEVPAWASGSPRAESLLPSAQWPLCCANTGRPCSFHDASERLLSATASAGWARRALICVHGHVKRGLSILPGAVARPARPAPRSLDG